MSENIDWARTFRAAQAAGEGFGRRELPAAIVDALADLPPKQFDAVRIVYLEGKSETDAADELGITQPAVSMRLKSARKRMTEFLCALQLYHVDQVLEAAQAEYRSRGQGPKSQTARPGGAGGGG